MKLICFILALLAAAPALAISDRYDTEIMASAERWLPEYDWNWWKAQIWQESRMKPDAVSPVGAGGLAQTMPGTFADHYREVSIAVGKDLIDRFDVEASLEVGAYYMRRCVLFWTTPRPRLERLKLGQACYNAGGGHLLKAQRLCGGALLWRGIKRCLPQVTGEHSTETFNYVSLIDRHYYLLIAMDY